MLCKVSGSIAAKEMKIILFKQALFCLKFFSFAPEADEAKGKKKSKQKIKQAEKTDRIMENEENSQIIEKG